MSTGASSTLRDDTDATTATGPRRRGLRNTQFLWVWGGLAAVVLLSILIAPGTLAPSALASMIPFAAILAIPAVGQTLVVQQRGIDLSIPGVMPLAAMTMCLVTASTNSVPIGIVVGLIVSVVVGIVNGLLVSFVAITPLVTTISVNALAMGGVLTLSSGMPVAAPVGFVAIARARPLGIPISAIIAVVIVAVVAVVIGRMTAGRRFVATGAGEEAARAAGVRVDLHVVAAYAGSALTAGIAGVLLCGFTGSATTDLGLTYLLPSVAAVVIGGTALTGGRGSVVATAVAALLLTQLSQITYALSAPTSVQLFVQSAVLVLAVALPRIRPPKRRAKASAVVAASG